MEFLAREVQDSIPKELVHKLTKHSDNEVGTATYAISRTGSTFSSSGGDSNTPVGGNKLIKFNINGSSFIDLQTFKVQFDLVNTNTTPATLLRPSNSCHGFFRRIKLTIGGSVAEDIENYNRTAAMFDCLKSKDSIINEDDEAFGQRLRLDDLRSGVISPEKYTGIPGGQRQTVSFRPLLGILNSKKFLHLQFCPIVLELELCDDYADPLIEVGFEGAGIDGGTKPFVAGTTSNTWSIDNCKVKVDTLEMDSSLLNAYSETLAAGGFHKIHYKTYHAYSQTMPVGTDFQMNVNRTLTRLDEIYMTLEGTRLIAKPADAAAYNDTATTSGSWLGKGTLGSRYNDFWCPMGEFTQQGKSYNSTGEVKNVSVAVGSKKLLDYDLTSISECNSALKRTVADQSNDVHSIDISKEEYQNNKFIVGIGLETLKSNLLTGRSLKNGEQLSVRFQYNTTTNKANKMHIVLAASNILEIGKTGCSVYE